MWRLFCGAKSFNNYYAGSVEAGITKHTCFVSQLEIAQSIRNLLYELRR